MLFEQHVALLDILQINLVLVTVDLKCTLQAFYEFKVNKMIN